MYINIFFEYGFYVETPIKTNQIITIKNKEEYCWVWCLIAYLHPAKNNPNRVINFMKLEFFKETKLPDIRTPYDLNHLKKIQKLNKDKMLFIVFNLNRNNTVNPGIISHNNPKGCNIFCGIIIICNDKTFSLRKSFSFKFYPSLKYCVSHRT